MRFRMKHATIWFIFLSAVKFTRASENQINYTRQRTICTRISLFATERKRETYRKSGAESFATTCNSQYFVNTKIKKTTTDAYWYRRPNKHLTNFNAEKNRFHKIRYCFVATFSCQANQFFRCCCFAFVSIVGCRWMCASSGALAWVNDEIGEEKKHNRFITIIRLIGAKKRFIITRFFLSSVCAAFHFISLF